MNSSSCPMRHYNGNCKPHGGFCTAVSKSICESLHNAYDDGRMAAAAKAGKIMGWCKTPSRTNADRIRSMSDEELARFLYKHVSCRDCPLHPCSVINKLNLEGCFCEIKKWLQSPAEGGARDA